jgi:hypothetical protein
MGNYPRSLEETSACGVVGMIVRIDDVADSGSEAILDEAAHCQRLFRIGEGVNDYCAFTCHYNTGSHLGVQVTGKNEYIVGDALTLHLSPFTLRELLANTARDQESQYSETTSENQGGAVTLVAGE